MKKNTIIAIFIGFFVLLGAVFFGWRLFSGKKSIQIDIQNPIQEVQENSAENSETQNAEEKQSAEPQKIQENNVANDAEIKTTEEKSTEIKNANKNDSKNAGKIVDKFVSWGFEKASDRKIDTIIIHSSYDALGKDPYSIDGIIAEYKQYGVSAHYLIARDGTTFQLVENKNIAYHAGESKVPDGRTGVNKFSIGVEMVNTENGKFADEQYSAVNQLIASLKKQYSIKYVLGHSDIAPGRKTDPWGIDWTMVQK